MVLPLLAAGAIGAGSAILGGIFGGSKKEYSITQHAPYETYAPQTTTTESYNIQYPSYQVIMNSPFASQDSKKEQSTQQQVTPTQRIDPQNAPLTQGTDMTTIAIIVVAGLVAYGFVSRRK